MLVCSSTVRFFAAPTLRSQERIRELLENEVEEIDIAKGVTRSKQGVADSKGGDGGIAEEAGQHFLCLGVPNPDGGIGRAREHRTCVARERHAVHPAAVA